MIKTTIRFLLCYFFLCGQVIAQTAAILPQGKTQFLDNNANPLSAGKVYFYIPATTTFKTTWQDAAETIPNANPVILDAGGRAIIYGDGIYRQQVRDRNNNLIYDALTASTGSGGGTGTGTGDGDLVGTIKPWAGLIVPNQYAFAYGQELSRTTYSALYTAITLQQNIACALGSPIATGLSDTSQIPVNAVIESICFAPGSLVVSKTSTTVTFNNNSSLDTTNLARFFLYGNGNGSTTFNVPDLRGYVIAGRTNMGGIASTVLTSTFFSINPQATGAKGGNQSSTLIASNLPAYTPTGTISQITPAGTLSGTPALSLSDSRTWGFQYTGTVGNNVGATPQYGIGTGVDQAVTTTGGSLSGTVNFAGGTFTGTPVTPTFTGAAQGGTSVAFSNVQPTQTLNYIIKILPDSSSSSTTVVTSLGNMTGDIACGAGLLCTGNVISVLNVISANITSVIAPATPAGANLKASAGSVYGVKATTIQATPVYIKFYNSASAPTCGSGTPIARFMIPVATTAAKGAGTNITFPIGIAFTTGIGYCVTGALLDNDTTAITANNTLVNIEWN